MYWLVLKHYLGRFVSAEYFQEINQPWHFKKYWKAQLAEVHKDWDDLTLAELDINNFPASTLSFMMNVIEQFCETI